MSARLLSFTLLPVLFLSVVMAGRPVSATQTEIVLQQGHLDEVLAVDYSPDGRMLASAGELQHIKLWDAQTGDLIRTLPGHADRIRSLAFHPDGRRLASCDMSGGVKLWDVTDGRLIHHFTNHTGFTRSLAFNRDGRTVTVGSTDKKLSFWDVESGALLRSLPMTEELAHVLFTPDGQYLVTASREGKNPVVRF